MSVDFELENMINALNEFASGLKYNDRLADETKLVCLQLIRTNIEQVNIQYVKGVSSNAPTGGMQSSGAVKTQCPHCFHTLYLKTTS